jgi:hypothetical protein
MRHLNHAVIAILLFASTAFAASKPHVITFGKWTAIKWIAGDESNKTLDLKVRGLYVDERLKEFTLGTPHEVTDRLFVVRRAFRLNDMLPEETTPHWRWERGGWLLVDRVSGRVTPLNLPEFDPYYSTVNWYRDYAAYCGLSDDGKKSFAIVAQLGRRKPILKQALGDLPKEDDPPDSFCSILMWQRQPPRVTFAFPGGQKTTYVVRGHAVDLASEEDKDEQ